MVVTKKPFLIQRKHQEEGTHETQKTVSPHRNTLKANPKKIQFRAAVEEPRKSAEEFIRS